MNNRFASLGSSQSVTRINHIPSFFWGGRMPCVLLLVHKLRLPQSRLAFVAGPRLFPKALPHRDRPSSRDRDCRPSRSVGRRREPAGERRRSKFRLPCASSAVTVCILRLLCAFCGYFIYTVCILQLPCVCIRTNKQAPFLDVYVCTFRSVADVLYVVVL